MADGFNLPITGDAKGFLRATKQAGDSADDLADALLDAARTGERAQDRLSDSVDHVSDRANILSKEWDSVERVARASGRGQERALEGVDREAKSLADTIENGQSKAYRQMEHRSREATAVASESMQEVKREALQNASETFSSFDGSAESFADGIQGTFGGLVSGLGPVGAAVGAAGAIGIGIIMAAMDKGSESSEAFRERVAELGDEFIETGRIGDTSLEFIVDKMRELATETEDGADNLEKLRRAADRSGDSYEDLARAASGNTTNLEDQLESGRERLRQLEREQDLVGTIEEQNGRGLDVVSRQIEGQTEYNQYLEAAATAAEKARTQAELYAQAGGPELERKAELIAAVNDAYDDAAGGAQDYINAESGVFDTAAYITAMDERRAALLNYQTDLAEAKLSPAAKSFLNDQGVDAAAQFLAGYKNATPAQQADLNRIWSEAGKENSGVYLGELEKGIPARMDGPVVVPRVDVGDARRALDNLVGSGLTKTVTVRVRDEFGRRLP